MWDCACCTLCQERVRALQQSLSVSYEMQALGGDVGNENLYDTGDDEGAQVAVRGSRPGAGDTLYDVGDDQATTAAPSHRASQALYDVGSDVGSHPAAGGAQALYDVGADGSPPSAPTQFVARSRPVVDALYDTGDDGGAPDAQPASAANPIVNAPTDDPAARHDDEEEAAGHASDPGYLLLNEH